MPYALYNENNQEKLTHPSIGMWYADDLNEATSMLEACQEYMTSMNLPEDFQKRIYIVDADTDEKIDTIL
jgi:hypothetical protein